MAEASTEIQFTGPQPTYVALRDAGWNGTAGINNGTLFMGVHRDWGLRDVSPESVIDLITPKLALEDSFERLLVHPDPEDLGYGERTFVSFDTDSAAEFNAVANGLIMLGRAAGTPSDTPLYGLRRQLAMGADIARNDPRIRRPLKAVGYAALAGAAYALGRRDH